MIMVHGRPFKRLVKRRVTAELTDFLTFPADSDLESYPEIGKPFRIKIASFLAKHALAPPPSSLFPQLVAWQIPFSVGDDGGSSVVCLDVVEEDVARSRSPYCDQCRVVGWSGNPVSAKRYHFIIKIDGEPIAGCNKPCAGCGDAVNMGDPRCKTCNHLMTAEDVEDWIYQQLESTTHLLHGVIHLNGYGHLLRVNGREGGSKVLSGRHILNFWDSLCRVLGARKVSVMDVSKKNGMDFRLLHAVMKGHPWYGEWGYKFGAGRFSRTLDDYNAAVAYLSSMPLSSFRSQGRKPRSQLQDLISFYQSVSDHDLTTLRDIFLFIVSLIQEKCQSPLRVDEPPCKKLKVSDSKTSSSWTADERKHIEDAMFKVLRAVSVPTWISWRALKGAVCRAGAPELLDHCVRELHGKEAAPGLVVRTRVSGSGGIEYRLEPGSANTQTNTSVRILSMTSYLSEKRLLQDLKYFYQCMLQPETMVSHVAPACLDLAVTSATTIIDCKQFIKDYQPQDPLLIWMDNTVNILCEVDLKEQSGDFSHNPPAEMLLLSPDATVADLKLEATRAFQEVYLIFRRFQTEELVGYSGVDESTQLKLLFGSTEFVRVRGKFLGKNALVKYRMERGVERWIVDCLCGAKDDDGERMLACDMCSIWQHTRCSGIPDSDGVPAKFSCHRCRSWKG